MKTLITALALAILISATQFVAAAPRDRRDAGQSRQSSAVVQDRRLVKPVRYPEKAAADLGPLGGGGRIVVR
jgi:hypothetical protein